MELRYTLVLLLLFVGLCDHQSRAQETPGWSCGDHRFCYQIWNEKVDRDTAKVKCKRQGEQAQENELLACPRNKMDNEQIYKYIKESKEEYWIGAVSLPNSNEWTCADEASSPIGNVSWAQGHPKASSLYTFIINGTVVSTTEKVTDRSFICQKRSNCFGTELSSSASPQTAISSSGTLTNDSNNVEFIQNVQVTRKVMSWQEVKEECEGHLGNLVCPYTPAKHEEVVQLIDMEKIKTLNVWIGLLCKYNVTRNFMCYEWQWVDGSANDNSWHKWANNEPGRGETVVRMRDGQWYAAIDARDAEYYICEKAAKWTKLPSPTISPSTKTSQATTDRNESGNTNGSFDPVRITPLNESGNLSLLAILTLVLPVVPIPTFVILFRRWKKDQNNAEHAASTQVRQNQGSNLELKDYEHLKNPFLATADNSFYASIGNDEYEYIDINAIYSAGIKFGFIPTRMPAVGNAANFWKTAWDNNCDTIIMLCTLDQLGRRLYYPHKDGESCDVTPFLVECNLIKPGKHISCQHLNVTLPGKEIRQFLHMHVLCEDLSEKASEELAEIFLEIYHRVRKRKLQFKKNTPNIVHCLNDAHWTGLFCAFCGVLDQIDLKKEVDISRVWHLLTPSHTQFISSKEQHIKLFEMILDFIKNQDQYSKILEGKEGFADISGNGRVKRHYENA